MSARGRSGSPASRDGDVDMDRPRNGDKRDAKVVLVTNLTRNVVEGHLKTIFGFYGELVKVDVPMFGKCK
jgi:RNA-binding protein with serine-rich domain 1